jgi:hypothetical protein
MFNPLLPDTSELKTTELETRINDLSRKYFIAANSGNSGLAQQILVVLEQYKIDLRTRNLKASQIPTKSGNTDLDDLIKVT